MKLIGSKLGSVAVKALLLLLVPNLSFAAARVMNPGDAKGQLVILSEKDVRETSEKFKSLNALSIPLFAELPMDMGVVAGAITIKQQNLLSHVQLKSRARKTPNLDISELEGGVNNAILKPFKDGDWIHMVLTADGKISITKSTEQDAIAAYNSKKVEDIKLRADMSVKEIIPSEKLTSKDVDKVGAKAANYGELARALNTPERTVVRTGYGIPFHFYQEFIDMNPAIKTAIDRILRDPLMNRIAKISYREEKLKALQAMMTDEKALVSDKLMNDLITAFDTKKNPRGNPRKMKLRSSTNSEDLPNFNGAGLYDSYSYKPEKDGKEKSRDKKIKSLKETLQKTWASVWNLRAYEERAFFRIPHGEVKMGIQVNPSFGDEGAQGVVVTRNVSKDARFDGQAGVYVEAQRGDKYSVMNPEANIKPEKILILFDARDPLNVGKYRVEILQKSNVADDEETILDHDNPTPVMSDDNAKDLAFQCLKAEAYFKPLLGPNKADFALDLEFKLDSEDNGVPTIYVKQARPYLE